MTTKLKTFRKLAGVKKSVLKNFSTEEEKYNALIFIIQRKKEDLESILSEM